MWPDGAATGPAGSVIIAASEDDLGDTLAPRLMAAVFVFSIAGLAVIVLTSDKRNRRSEQAAGDR